MLCADGFDAGGCAVAIEPTSSGAHMNADADMLRTAPIGGRDRDW
jgi:hypothetical protein